MDEKIQEYLEEMIAFNPATATDDERQALIVKGRTLVESNIDVTPTSIEEIIERRKKGVDTSTIKIPVHMKSEIDLQLSNVDKILETQKMTQERYMKAAGAIVKIFVSLLI